MGPTGAPSWCRGLLPVLLLILLLHAHMSCITLASGRGIRCRGPQGSQQSRQQRQQPSNGGGFPTVAAWRVLLWHRPCQPPQQQQQQRSLQETGDVAFISSWGSRAACPSGASGRLSSAATLSSAAAAAVPVTAAAAVADAAAASAQQAAIAAAAATSLLFRRPPARHMEDAWQRWGPRKAAAALVGHAVGAPRTAGEAAPAARGAAPAATAAAGVAARPSTVGAYGSRKYRLVLLMSGELSVTDTQTIVRNYYLQLLRLKGKQTHAKGPLLQEL